MCGERFQSYLEGLIRVAFSFLFWLVCCTTHAVSGTFAFASDDSKIKVIGEYAKPSRSSMIECTKVLPEGHWIGAEDGSVITSLSVTWVATGASVDVPKKFLCGFFDTPDKSTTNPLGLQVMQTGSGDQVIIDNVLEGFDYTFRTLIYIEPRGNVEQVTLPFGSLAPVLYSSGVYLK